MARINIRRTHSLSPAQARKAADSVARELASEYGVQSSWRGDTLHFNRSGLEGQLRLEPKALILDLTLGFLLMAFKQRIVEGVESRLDRLLADDDKGGGRKKGTAPERRR